MSEIKNNTNFESVAIVTITFNSSHVIEQFINSLNNSEFINFKLFFIDNYSTDNTIKLIEKKANFDFEIIKNKKNKGVASANNIGIKLAIDQSFKKIIISNNDIYFSSNVIGDLLKFHSSNCNDIVTTKIMYSYDHKKIWYCGGFFNFSKGLVPEHIGIGKSDFGQFDHIVNSSYAPTCFVLFNSNIFSEIGFMDEKYFVYFDDTDFFYRIRKNGKYKLSINQKIKIFHKVGSSTSENNLKKIKSNFFIRQNIQNHFYFLKKNERLYFYLFIPYLIFRYNLRILLSNQFRLNFNSLLLVNKSILKGILK